MFKILPLYRDQEKTKHTYLGVGKKPKTTREQERPAWWSCWNWWGTQLPPCHELNHLFEGQPLGRQHLSEAAAFLRGGRRTDLTVHSTRRHHW